MSRQRNVFLASMNGAERSRRDEAKRAEHAWGLLQNKETAYAQELADIAAAHRRAADVYAEAAKGEER